MTSAVISLIYFWLSIFHNYSNQKWLFIFLTERLFTFLIEWREKNWKKILDKNQRSETSKLKEQKIEKLRHHQSQQNHRMRIFFQLYNGYYLHYEFHESNSRMSHFQWAWTVKTICKSTSIASNAWLPFFFAPWNEYDSIFDVWKSHRPKPQMQASCYSMQTHCHIKNWISMKRSKAKHIM